MTFAGVPNSFVNGTTADAPSVNQNFDATTSGLNNIDAGQITTGTLPVTRGGTGGATAAVAAANILGAPLFSSATPSPGGAITSASQLMFGATTTFTPATTGKMKITASGSVSNLGASGVTLQLRAATGGTPPVYNAAASGTILAATLYTSSAGSSPVPFSLTGIITLTAGAAAWCDLSASIGGGNTGSIANLTVVIDEKPI